MPALAADVARSGQIIWRRRRGTRKSSKPGPCSGSLSKYAAGWLGVRPAQNLLSISKTAVPVESNPARSGMLPSSPEDWERAHAEITVGETPKLAKLSRRDYGGSR